MHTKTFKVILEVYGCNNCPYNNQIIGCEKAGSEDYEKLEDENRFELTTCPMLKE